MKVCKKTQCYCTDVNPGSRACRSQPSVRASRMYGVACGLASPGFIHRILSGKTAAPGKAQLTGTPSPGPLSSLFHPRALDTLDSSRRAWDSMLQPVQCSVCHLVEPAPGARCFLSLRAGVWLLG
uniref:Uncharacterized protein n=1 Tax=Pipistrellus kuhlii TaxID=59472 RepID=A0A7J8A8F1_PIPKU|nr:hypothetical protein mPipKuh1_008974 [Pipistrellus kuhlii]